MENGEECTGETVSHPRGCLSVKQIIYSAGGLGGVICWTCGGVGLTLGAERLTGFPRRRRVLRQDPKTSVAFWSIFTDITRQVRDRMTAQARWSY